MPGINTKGTPQTDNYNLGRGIVYGSKLNSASKPTGYRDFGNATEFNISIESETLEHESSRQGLKSVDKEVLISQKMSLSVTFDEVSFDNVSLFMSGETASYANPTQATAITIAAADNLGAGFWYDIVDDTGNRMYDIDTIVFDSAHTDPMPGSPVSGTDYLLDKVMGRFFIPTGTGLAAMVAGTNTIVFTVTFAGGRSTTVDEVRALTKTAEALALKFISANPVYGDHKTEYEFHKVSLKAEGDFGLIGDEWTTMTLTGAAEKNEAAGGVASPTLTLRTFDGGAAQ